MDIGRERERERERVAMTFKKRSDARALHLNEI